MTISDEYNRVRFKVSAASKPILLPPGFAKKVFSDRKPTIKLQLQQSVTICKKATNLPFSMFNFFPPTLPPKLKRFINRKSTEVPKSSIGKLSSLAPFGWFHLEVSVR